VQLGIVTVQLRRASMSWRYSASANASKIACSWAAWTGSPPWADTTSVATDLDHRRAATFDGVGGVGERTVLIQLGDQVRDLIGELPNEVCSARSTSTGTTTIASSRTRGLACTRAIWAACSTEM
jgi:hypothetical protein